MIYAFETINNSTKKVNNIELLTIYGRDLETYDEGWTNVRIHVSTPHNVSSRSQEIVHTRIEILRAWMKLVGTGANHFHISHYDSAQ